MSARDAYFAAARAWADSAEDGARRAARRAWTVAAVFGATTLLLAIAVALLLPLRHTETIVLTVDRATGAVGRATTLETARLTENEAVISAEIAAYVRAREAFDATDLPQTYRYVQLHSAPDARRAYEAAMSASNPLSPLRTLQRGDTVAVTIRSVSLIGPRSGLVRFTTRRTSADGRALGENNYLAAIAFGFSSAPLSEADRLENPLGFTVMRYRRDADGL